MLKEECKEYINHSLIVLSEKRSVITFFNVKQSEIVKVKIDECQLKDEQGKKCDYLLLKNERETFVELKGSNVNKAIKQLQESIAKVSQQSKTSEKSAFIVCSRIPLRSAEIDVKRRLFKSGFNAELTITKSNKTYELK